ncbi:hypothetical protein VNO78_30623 [Psophocarpus tetragonolobus]|uniref:Uncharacterized protein n=1 Tax=Psophocarpus tetragonolobus TaxID=3891 RepID=A0AAN9RXE6_PSOTE
MLGQSPSKDPPITANGKETSNSCNKGNYDENQVTDIEEPFVEVIRWGFVSHTSYDLSGLLQPDLSELYEASLSKPQKNCPCQKHHDNARALHQEEARVLHQYKAHILHQDKACFLHSNSRHISYKPILGNLLQNRAHTPGFSASHNPRSIKNRVENHYLQNHGHNSYVGQPNAPQQTSSNTNEVAWTVMH